MARQPRVEYPGALYHVMNRGDHREEIVRGDPDGKLFVDTLGDACGKTGWQVHAFCLMPNHFHLVVETPQANLSAGMQWFVGTYTNRFNRRHQLFGHLFSGRFKSLLVDDRDGDYLRTVCQYVHLNPARAGLIKPDVELEDYDWSSFPEYLKSPKKRIEWLRVDRLFGELGIAKDSSAGRRRFRELTEKHRAAEDPDQYSKIRRGWCFGGETFRKRCRKAVGRKLKAEHSGVECKESQQEHAEALIAAELKRLRLKNRQLAKLPKGAAEKVQIARTLRRETVVPFTWIAERLSMGSRTYAQNLVYAAERANS